MSLAAFLLVSWCAGPLVRGLDDLDRTQFEAAFQGRCGHESPCEQLCYELHDGMFECDCKRGFVLHHDGYSCLELNTTTESPREDAGTEIAEDILYQKDASFSARLVTEGAVAVASGAGGGEGAEGVSTSQSPPAPESSTSCSIDCGPNGACILDGGSPRCQCPLTHAGPSCHNEVRVRWPRFWGQGWLAFPALKAAYKHVQLEIEFRPQSPNGILFLTGERDDLAGDFMALLIYKGFVEFRFDCGSGVGVVKSDEKVMLNRWNRITLYRHRWDASVQLNSGNHVQGRSKGLFSRMTFREPVFIGGRGNTSGLQEKLPTDKGLKGCIRHLQINDYVYNFAPVPRGDAVKGFDIDECVEDVCSKVECGHGGKCLSSVEGGAQCLCPLGYTGHLCQTTLDIQVPAFNGSSYLRYPGLGSSALSWLDLVLVVKPNSQNGVILYNGHRSDGVGDFMAVYISEGHLEFTFDLGTGAATVRSAEPVSVGEWHEVRVSRTGRMAVMQVDKRSSSQVLSPGAFTQLYLPLNMYVGGVPNFDMVSPKVKVRSSFVGCIQKVTINNRLVEMVGEALAGVNVENCGHPCASRPCGETGRCVPHHDAYKCVCDRHCQQNDRAPVSPIASFSSNTYLHYTDPDIIARILSNKVSINMRLRTTASSGLILWTGRIETTIASGDFLAVGIRDGYLHLRYNLGSGEGLIVYNATRVDDGNWHRMKATRNEQEGSLTVDSGDTISSRSPGKLKQLNTNTGLYIGGMEEMELATHYKYHRGFFGCISELTFNSDFHVKLALSTNTTDHCGDVPP